MPAPSLSVRLYVGATGGNITIRADDMVIEVTAIDAGTGTVTLKPVTAGQVINLGTTANPAPAGTLGLSNAELGEVTAAQLIIGSATNTGGIVVTDNITATANGTLELLTGGAITDPGGFTLDPTNLALSAANGIGTSAAPMVTAATNLVAQNTTSGGIFISNSMGGADHRLFRRSVPGRAGHRRCGRCDQPDQRRHD